MKTPKMIIRLDKCANAVAIFVFLNGSDALDIDFTSILFYCSFKVNIKIFANKVSKICYFTLNCRSNKN